MATTTHYSFTKPTVGADNDLWGGFLNDNWDDADTELKSLQDQITALEAKTLIPVGGLYLSVSATNPGTELGYGTWVEYASGRALVGVGSNGESTWTAAQESGSETHILTEAQMPAHTHFADPPATATTFNGDHVHTPANGGTFLCGTGVGATQVQFSGGSGNKFETTTNNTGGHTHTVDIPGFTTGNAGSSVAHNNIQPSIGVHVWRRTA